MELRQEAVAPDKVLAPLKFHGAQEATGDAGGCEGPILDLPARHARIRAFMGGLMFLSMDPRRTCRVAIYGLLASFALVYPGTRDYFR